MSQGERIGFLGQGDLPREVFSALLEGPAFLCGLDEKQRAGLRSGYRSTYHADDVAQINQMRDALAEHDAVVQIASNDAADAGGFTPKEFAAFTAA
jgi:hypothetical protein